MGTLNDLFGGFFGDDPYKKKPKSEPKERKGFSGDYGYHYTRFGGAQRFSAGNMRKDIMDESIVHPNMFSYEKIDLHAALSSEGIHSQLFNDFVVEDIYKLFNYKTPKYMISKEKLWWWDILTNIDTFLLKIVTTDRVESSYIAVREILKQLMKSQAPLMKFSPDGNGKNQADTKDKHIKFMKNMNNLNDLLDKKRNIQKRKNSLEKKLDKLENPDDDSNSNNNDPANNDPSSEDFKDPFEAPKEEVEDIDYGMGEDFLEEQVEGQAAFDFRDDKDKLRDLIDEFNDDIKALENEIFESRLENGLSKMDDAIDKGMKNAEKKIEELEEAKEQTAGKNAADFRFDVPKMKDMLAAFAKVKVSKRELQRAITTIIKRGAKRVDFGTEEVVDKEFLEADDIHSLVNPEMILFPPLIDDLTVKDTRREFMIDLYVDVSGSMGSKIPLFGEKAQKLNLAKFLANQMNTMGILNKLYVFNTSLKEWDKDNIWKMGVSGGTHIDCCINNIEHTGNASIILTDGQDEIYKYLSNVFVLSLENNPLNGYGWTKVVKKLDANRQYWIWKDNKMYTPTTDRDSGKRINPDDPNALDSFLD